MQGSRKVAVTGQALLSRRWQVLAGSLLLCLFLSALVYTWAQLKPQKPVPSSTAVKMIAPPPTEPPQAPPSAAPTPGEILLPGDTLKHPVSPSEAKGVKPFYRAAEGGKRVALTFDDGPYPGLTERYLAVLERMHAPATFFVIGCRAERYPHLVKLMREKGHEVGSHSWWHANLGRATKEEVRSDLVRTARVLEGITGEPVKFFRPPYGAVNSGVLEIAEELGEKVVLWDVDPRDWTNPGPQTMVKRVLSQVRDGSIILLHEGRPGTLEALPTLIRELRNRGYELVTLSELLQPAPEKKKAGISMPAEEKAEAKKEHTAPSVTEATYQSPLEAGAGEKAPPALRSPEPLPPRR
ncbi:polysaccharide deacetylase family protein [Ammonifex thiophilus]|uniref:polysaccharide deacetylase family protein n=1 Tax=Ammonifex thiophilus TaxID=444093 RepID=UPI00106AA7DD|nr:polysaccharide deacetylase family protein [Ammonifex thiophilus]